MSFLPAILIVICFLYIWIDFDNHKEVKKPAEPEEDDTTKFYHTDPLTHFKHEKVIDVIADDHACIVRDIKTGMLHAKDSETARP